MKLEWLNSDFFCYDGKQPYYNLNYIRWITVHRAETAIGNEYNIVLYSDTGTTYNMGKYPYREDAQKEIKEFLKNRPNMTKDNEKILVD